MTVIIVVCLVAVFMTGFCIHMLQYAESADLVRSGMAKIKAFIYYALAVITIVVWLIGKPLGWFS